jgi:urate oxidase
MSIANLIQDTITELQSPHYRLQNVRVFLKKDSLKGIYHSTIISITGSKHQLVAQKMDYDAERALQKTKQAFYRQMAKTNKRELSLMRSRSRRSLSSLEQLELLEREMRIPA